MLDEVTIRNVIDRDSTKDFREHVWKDYRNIKVYDGYNLLQYAIYNSSVNIVEFLLDRNYYDIDYQSIENGDTALIIAMNDFTEEAVDSVNMIFRYNSNVNVDLYNTEKVNAVGAGIYSGIQSDLVVKCAEKITDYDLKDSSGDTVISKCLNNYELFKIHMEVIEIYIKGGAHLTDNNIFKIMIFIKDEYENNIIWKAIQSREDLSVRIVEIATDKNMLQFLPEEVQDIFIF